MKSYISKFFTGAALIAAAGLASSCVGDLDQLPKDPGVLTPADFNKDPEGYLSGVMAKCYAGLATSGSFGRNGAADLEGMDGGTSQFTRATFYLNEFPADEALWIWMDGGVEDLLKGTWSDSNQLIYGFYSRFYVEIAICNDFLRLTTPESLATYDIQLTDELQKQINQYRLEARALRDLSYYNVIDFFGRSTLAWDDQNYGEVPPQAESRAALYEKVVTDLEDVLANFPDAQPVFGRIGKDAVEALLAKFYLNAGVWTGTPAWDKCLQHCENIIKRHQGGGFNGSGLAVSYLSLFCGNNHIFFPGGSLTAQNEVLWGVPYAPVYNEPWGGNTFQVLSPLWGHAEESLDNGFCNSNWYGTTGAWGCMHATKQLSEKFNFVNGISADARAHLWLTDIAGWRITNDNIAEALDGYPAIKFTNVYCNSDGSMPTWRDPESNLGRCGVQPLNLGGEEPETCLPIFRLADIYLMVGECALNGAGDRTKALTYVNYVRERAGVDAWTPSQLTADNLLDERARELYYEGFRRTDLIRFGKFTGNSYLWSWKGGTVNGTTLPDYRAVYPIPSSVLSIYGSNIEQNAGY